MALVDGFLELERSSGKLEWSAILQKMASDLGFSKILFGLLPKDSQDYENAFIVGNYPAAWREHYDRAGYARVDPTVSHCTQSVLPIFWEPSIYQTRKQHEFFEEASAAGLVYGLTMPLHGARGELGALSLSVEAENRAEANRFMESVLPTLWMLKDYALQSGAGLAFEHPVSKPVVLTSREKEVLQWCAIGKTSWEISVICNCSEANVNFHMGNIRRKFGVTSRRVAAIMAVNLGLIILSDLASQVGELAIGNLPFYIEMQKQIYREGQVLAILETTAAGLAYPEAAPESFLAFPSGGAGGLCPEGHVLGLCSLV